MTTSDWDELVEVPLEAELAEEAVPPCQLNMDMLKSVAMYVPGRKRAAMTARAFMAELSLVAATATRAAKRLSSCAILLLSYGAKVSEAPYELLIDLLRYQFETGIA